MTKALVVREVFLCSTISGSPSASSERALFTLTAALSLAIGIGANTTIFSVASALLLRPLPGLSEPDRLVDLGRTTRGEGFDTVSHPYYRSVRERATLVDVYAYREPMPMSLGGRDAADRVYGTIVSANYFTVVGTRPVSGRMLEDRDVPPHRDNRPHCTLQAA